MLRVLRKHKAGLFGFVVASLLTLMMMNFGLGSYFSKDKNAAAITVDDVKISFAQYGTKYEQLSNYFQTQYGKSFPQVKKFLNIQQQVIDGLIADILYQRYFKELGITAGAHQMEEYVARTYFPTGITTDAYRQFLQRIGMSGEQFEGNIRNQLVREQLENLFANFSDLSTEELAAIYRAQNRKLKFAYLEFHPEKFSDENAPVEAKELEDYFSAHREDFRIPKKILYDYLVFDPKDYESQVEVLPEDLSSTYREHSIEFRDPARFFVRRLIVPKATDDNGIVEKMVMSKEGKADAVAEVKKKAIDALAELKSGAALEDVATKYAPGSDVAALAPNWVTLAELDKEVQKAVSALSAGEYSNVFEVKNGFEIVYVQERKEAIVKPLEDVKPQVEHLLRVQQAPVYAQAAAENFLKVAQRKTDANGKLADVDPKFSSRVMLGSEPLSEKEDPTGLSGLTEQLLQYGEGEVGIARLAGRNVVARITKIQESKIPELSEIRDQVITAFRKSEGQTNAKEAAEKVLKEMAPTGASAPSLEEVHRTITEEQTKSGAEFHETTLVGAMDVGDSFLKNFSIREKLFTLSEQDPVLNEVVESDGSYFVITVSAIQLPTEEAFEKELPSLRQRERAAGGNRVMQALLERLKEQHKIWINPSLYERNNEL